jgi:hypothetical protein
MRNSHSFSRYTGRYHTHHTARQIINCFDAIELARKVGIEWMISIDPDELICLDKDRTDKDALTELLHNLPSSIQAVTFPTLEVIPRKVHYYNVFAEETFFKAPYSFGEGRRLGESALGIDEIPEPRTLGSPDEIQYKWKGFSPAATNSPQDSLYHNEYLHGALDVPHFQVHNPKQSSHLTFDWYVGHFIGKQAFRIGREISFKSLHRVAVESRENELLSGCLLHYNNYSATKFWKKYKAFSCHPESYTLGYSVDKLKIFLRNLVNYSGLEYKACADIFSNSFVVDEHRLSIIHERWPESIQIVEGVKEHFSRQGQFEI